MSSQFNAFAASTHRADLHREAEQSRQLEERAGDRSAATESPFPTLLRSRRLGRVFRAVPSPERRSA